MGAWGTGSFDNDDAGDWVVELEAAEDFSPISSAFDAVLEVGDDYLELPEAGAGIAAAEVVAALLGKPSSEIRILDGVVEWVTGKPPPPDRLVKQARRVVKRVLKDSELKECWEEATDAAAWQQGVEDLLRRLDTKQAEPGAAADGGGM
ncbi:MAG TPA: DUF4259 domain-containing protein [Gemmatales bacterium]|nr:DUF4259 domain-containing protein [Gemmatales bacterium]